jgi:long-subunit fatty acid transport protein
MKKLLAIALLFLVSFEVKAQFMEDGVRLLNNNGMISSRSGSMGIGFAGIADDFSALYYNPAGLSLIPKAELSIGFGISNINNDNNFKWDTHSIDVNDEFISHIGVASPLRSNTGLNSVIAVGYFREASFDNTVKIEGFNNSSTYIRNDAERNGTNGFAHDMYLSNGNVTPYQNDLTQSAYIDESGGIHNVIGGAGFELTDQVSIGFSIVGKWGSYSYSKDFRETDTQNKYKTSTDEIYGDLDELQVKSHVTQDISGISGTVGFLAKPTENSRISVGVKFPTVWTRSFTQITMLHLIQVIL